MKNNIFKTIITILLLIGISALLFQGNYVPIYGENQYTFSYLGHIGWIITDWIEKPSLLFQSHNCIDCQYFGMYSRWVMLWLYIILLPGQLLMINPFIWYVFISFVFQYVAIKYFLESLFPKSHFGTNFMLILSAFFTTIPYKWVQIGIQWEYPFVYFMFFTIVGTYFRLIRNEKLTRHHILLSIASALLIFNISINHLPIVLYTLLTLTLVSFFSSRDKISLVKILCIICIPSLALNVPILISLLSNPDVTQFESFHSNGWPVLLSLGYLSGKHSNNFIALSTLIGLSTIFFSILSLKKKSSIIFLLLTIIGLFLGILGKEPIYQIIFDNFPLFHTLRSAYRFVIFEHMFLVVLIGYLYIYTRTTKNYKWFKYLFTTVLMLNVLFISQDLRVINFTKIPEAYEDTYTFIKEDNHRYIYFPSQLNVSHTISTDYSYGNVPSEFYWWQNPFESWYPSRNVHHPTLNMSDSELDRKISDLAHQNKQEMMVETLKHAGIDYIIFDDYYYWAREVPEFDISAFFTRDELRLMRKFGAIEIYSVN